MSTLEKTIHLLNTLPENQIETIYSFVQFISMQNDKLLQGKKEPIDDILSQIVGAVPDQGKTLDEYRAERVKERYEAFD